MFGLAPSPAQPVAFLGSMCTIGLSRRICIVLEAFQIGDETCFALHFEVDSRTSLILQQDIDDSHAGWRPREL